MGWKAVSMEGLSWGAIAGDQESIRVPWPTLGPVPGTRE